MKTQKIVWFAAASLLLTTTLARGESAAPSCPPEAVSVMPAPESVTVPSNIPAIGYIIKAWWEVSSIGLIGPDSAAITLGADAPAMYGWVAKPLSAPLPEGTGYKLIWTQQCQGYPSVPPTDKVRGFNVGPAVELPTSIGTLSMTPHQVDSQQYTCHIAVALTPQMLAYMGVAYTWTYWGGGPYGGTVTLTANGNVLEADPALSCGVSGRFGHVQESFEFGAEILGAATQPPKLVANAVFECPLASDPSVEAGPGMDARDEQALYHDADSLAPPAAGSTQEGCGCRSCSRSAHTNTLVLCVFGALAGAMARRRRQSPNRHVSTRPPPSLRIR